MLRHPTPFIILADLGLLTSIGTHVVSLFGSSLIPTSLVWALHAGIFIVWMPALLGGYRLISFRGKKSEIWTTALRGSPKWMKRMAQVSSYYALLNFMLYIFIIRNPDGVTQSSTSIPSKELAFLSSIWVVFYSMSLALLFSYSRIQQQRCNRHCPNGHPVDIWTMTCKTCGATISNDQFETAPSDTSPDTPD